MKNLAAYIHIPFCVKKCAYCDFNSIPLKANSIGSSYINALIRDINRHDASCEKKYRVDTIYLGGGTPSVLSPADISKVLKTLGTAFSLKRGAETTIEVNPGTVTYPKLKAYSDIGINRLSIGAQSFIDRELTLLGRIHTAKETYATCAAARAAGFNNISLDLIFGLPGQDSDSLRYSLGEILRLSPEHISTYSLTVEKGTPLARTIAQEKLPHPDQEVQADMFRSIIRTLEKYGYRHYEISNFAKNGYESKHNQAYWTGKEYIGFGAGAHSYIGGVRSANTKDVSQYIARNRIKRSRKLSPDEQSRERIVLGLRMRGGIAVPPEVRSRKDFLNKIEPLIDQGLLEYRGGRLKLTGTGVFFYDTVAVELL